MKDEWINHCLALARHEEDFYSGCRKIICNHSLTFKKWDNTLQLKDAGYTSNKMRMLERNYLNEASRSAAVMLWKKRRGQGRYGSVGFSTYNHFVKGSHLTRQQQGKPSRASVMGPCIQSVVITLLDNKTYSLAVFYRTTELFKKFPADLVFLRDQLMTPFDFSGLKFAGMRCFFANITCHPMYAVTFLPHLSVHSAIEELNSLKKRDRYFFDWVIKWTGRYICPEYHRGIAKFSQALRVQSDAYNRLDKKHLSVLRKYVKDNHPGYRGDYVDPEDDE